jgi:hypothetical protein
MMAESQSTGHRYGVVACPRCRHAHGFELKSRTTTCGRCGKRADARRLHVLYRCDDPDQLRTAVGVIEARLIGGESALINLEALQEEIDAKAHARSTSAPPATGDEHEIVQWAASRAAGEQGTQPKIRRIMEALEEAFPQGFTEDQLEAAFEAAGLPRERAEKEIRAGLVRDELYEPRPGRLKRL